MLLSLLLFSVGLPIASLQSHFVNEDGISRVYESIWESEIDGAENPTGDGYSNLQKYLFGGWPDDRWAGNDLMLFEQTAPDEYQLGWRTATGLRFQVEASTNLVDWIPLGDPVTATDTWEAIGTQSSADGYFWRVRGLGSLDSDGDGLSDYDEFLLGTNPLNPDTAGDGLSDGFSWFFGLDLFDPDQNESGILDGDEDWSGDGVVNKDKVPFWLDPAINHKEVAGQVVSFDYDAAGKLMQAADTIYTTDAEGNVEEVTP